MIEARATVSGLRHRHHVWFNVVRGHSRGVDGEIAKEVPKVLLLAALNQEPGDAHIHVHAEMPIRHALIDVAGKI